MSQFLIFVQSRVLHRCIRPAIYNDLNFATLLKDSSEIVLILFLALPVVSCSIFDTQDFYNKATGCHYTDSLYCFLIINLLVVILSTTPPRLVVNVLA